MYSEWEWHVVVKKGDLVSLQTMLDNVGSNAFAELNTKFKNETLLATAIKCGFIDIVKLLLTRGADPNIKSSETGRNEPPLLTATRWKNMEIVKLLLDYGGDSTQTGFYGHDVIFQAVIDNVFDILEYFLQIPKRPTHEPKNCPIRYALKYAVKFSCKRKCLFMLFQYGYSCACLRIEDKVSLQSSCAEILNIVNTSLVVVNLPMTLFNLTRITIRHHILTNPSTSGNLFTKIGQLQLPNKLCQALLLKEFTNYEILDKSNSHANIIHVNVL